MRKWLPWEVFLHLKIIIILLYTSWFLSRGFMLWLGGNVKIILGKWPPVGMRKKHSECSEILWEESTKKPFSWPMGIWLNFRESSHKWGTSEVGNVKSLRAKFTHKGLESTWLTLILHAPSVRLGWELSRDDTEMLSAVSEVANSAFGCTCSSPRLPEKEQKKQIRLEKTEVTN